MNTLLFGLLLSTSPTTAVEVRSEKGYVVEAAFVSTAPVQVKWDVLTDYNNAANFVKLITTSTLIPPDTLKQEMRGRFWFFRKTIDFTVRIEETLYNKVAFESILGTDTFYIRDGAWEIRENNIVSIRYMLIVRKNFFVPKALIRGVLRKETKRYIRDVKREIERRAYVR